VVASAAVFSAHFGWFLQTLQSQHDELEKAFRKERAALEEKYAKLYGEQQHPQQQQQQQLQAESKSSNAA
jgi:hypothetical protein